MNKKLIRCNAKYKNTKQNQYFSNNANHQPKAPSIHWSKNEVAEKKKRAIKCNVKVKVRPRLIAFAY